MEWFSENLASLILLFCVVFLLSALIYGLLRMRRKKLGGCAGGCAFCPYSEGCKGKDAEK